MPIWDKIGTGTLTVPREITLSNLDPGPLKVPITPDDLWVKCDPGTYPVLIMQASGIIKGRLEGGGIETVATFAILNDTNIGEDIESLIDEGCTLVRD